MPSATKRTFWPITFKRFPMAPSSPTQFTRNSVHHRPSWKPLGMICFNVRASFWSVWTACTNNMNTCQIPTSACPKTNWTKIFATIPDWPISATARVWTAQFRFFTAYTVSSAFAICYTSTTTTQTGLRSRWYNWNSLVVSRYVSQTEDRPG